MGKHKKTCLTTLHLRKALLKEMKSGAASGSGSGSGREKIEDPIQIYIHLLKQTILKVHYHCYPVQKAEISGGHAETEQANLGRYTLQFKNPEVASIYEESK